MAFYESIDPALARALNEYAPMLAQAEVKIGALLGCGNQGCVFEGDRGNVVKIGFLDDEVKLSNLLMSLDPHPGFVRTVRALNLPHKNEALRGKLPGLSVLVRERLKFDADRGDSVLGILEMAEMVYNAASASALVAWVAKGGKTGTLTAAKVVERTMREMAALDATLSESDIGEVPTEKDAKDAADVLDALAWLRKQGIILGDLWAAGFGRGFGTKPENIGWRGQQVVIADLGVWRKA